MSVKTIIHKSVPDFLLKRYCKSKIIRTMQSMQRRYPQTISMLREKEKITVFFFIMNASIWKLDELFRLMMEDDRFEPTLVVTPTLSNTDEGLLQAEMDLCVAVAQQKGYPYIDTRTESGTWLDVRSLRPDIIFFPSPYLSNVLPQYFVTNFPNSLSCYVTYSSLNFWDFEWELNQPFHNYVWRYFAENEMVKEYMCKVGLGRGENCFTSGYPTFDAYLRSSYTPRSCWRHAQPTKIIWAPHHTIDNCKILQYSNFLEMAEPMVEIAKKYADRVQFAFKPHPMLRQKLEKIWGKEKTDSYYAFWQNADNAQLEPGEYIDLFYTSDAMIFDSSSFITEYLYTQHPSMFVNKKSTEGMLNEIGLAAMNCHCEGKMIEDVECFICDVIEHRATQMQACRKAFYAKYIAPYNTPTPSQNILNHLKEVLS